MADPDSQFPEAAISRDIVHRISAGDRRAEAELVSRYRDRLIFALVRTVTDQTQLDDLANEALLRGIERLRAKPIEDPTRLGGFLYGIARNLQREAWRKAERQVSLEESHIESLSDPGPSQEEITLATEKVRFVREIMSSISNDRYRELLTRYLVHQEDKAQICADMNMTSLRFNSVFKRAKDRLQELLASSDYAGDLVPSKVTQLRTKSAQATGVTQDG